ncbi:MAG: M48 family metallopeptidase [Tidjanibacter sp.]|nr:M48 family metallopeptidase [Tidjanibacter sp.]
MLTESQHVERGRELLRQQKYTEAVSHFRAGLCGFRMTGYNAAALLAHCYDKGLGVERSARVALDLYNYVLTHSMEYRGSWVEERKRALEQQNLPQHPTTELQTYTIDDALVGRVIIRQVAPSGERQRSDKWADDSVTTYIAASRPFEMAFAYLWQKIYKRESERQPALPYLHRTAPPLPEVIDEIFERNYELFGLRVERGEGSDYSWRRDAEGRYTVVVPQGVDWKKVCTREAIVRYGMMAMRDAAERYLPGRLAHWSQRTGIGCGGCKIVRSFNVLGRCRMQGRNIDLSLHLMKYPALQADSVVVHELCHLVEPNHYNEFYYAIEKYGGPRMLRADYDIGDTTVPPDI